MVDPSSLPAGTASVGAGTGQWREALQAAIAAARSVEALAAVAAQQRQLAGEGLRAGAGVLATTQRISQVNDAVTECLVRLHADELGLDLRRACWLVFGSQGRSEQTLATDQDNGLVFESDDAASERARWLELGQRVNLALNACGYPLCKGRVMAGQPGCCLSAAEWCERFDDWMEHGAPADLLNASIYFDLRALVGRHDLAAALRQRITERAAALPRFLKQMADNALGNRAPLGWFGKLRASRRNGRRLFDLKMQGTMLFVDAARLYALAQGIVVTGTVERLDAVAQAMQVPAHESAAWRHGFEGLQRLRLQAQDHAGPPADNPNLIALDTLTPPDRERLEQGVRAARLLQQRIELDYQR